MTRILFVTNDYPTNERPGNSPCVEQQGIALRRLGYEVDVLFINGKETRFNYLKAIFHIFWKTQIRKQYDLIHAHYGYCGVVARFQSRCPVVVTFRGSDVLSKLNRSLSRLVARCVSRIIVMTEQMKHLLGKDDAQVIPYGIDFEVFKPAEQVQVRQTLDLPLKSPLVLFPYDPTRRMKRYDLVKQAIERVKIQFPSVQLVYIYDKPHAVVAKYMNACDALVLASDWEGAPVALREAMACNLPVVSVDVGDVVQIIRNTEGCCICEQNPDDIASKLVKVLETRKRTNGRSAVLEFDANKAVADVAKIYQEILGKPPANRANFLMR